ILTWSGVLRGSVDVLKVTVRVSDRNYLGNPLIMIANISCYSRDCHVELSDDPVTPLIGDPTARPLSFMRLHLPPLHEAVVPVNLSIYGNFSLKLEGCDSWLVNFEGVLRNESLVHRPMGNLLVRSPSEPSSCEVKFILVEPSNFSKSLIESKLASLVKEFSLLLETFEPQLRIEVGPKELRAGRPFIMKITLANPGDLEVNASLKLPIEHFRLLSVVYSTRGEFKKVREDLLWRLELPAKGSAVAQLVLTPEVEGELILSLRLFYSVSGFEHEKVSELYLKVLGETESPDRASESPKNTAWSGFDTEVSERRNQTDSEARNAPDESYLIEEEKSDNNSVGSYVRFDNGIKTILLTLIILAFILVALLLSTTRRR
ncbi:MAG: hypothetical protein RMI85_05920, partial [Candidatus Korarchaeum sp.]|nr:hypothetical protein [Candidatus Korarchaeum sp.]